MVAQNTTSASSSSPSPGSISLANAQLSFSQEMSPDPSNSAAAQAAASEPTVAQEPTPASSTHLMPQAASDSLGKEVCHSCASDTPPPASAYRRTSSTTKARSKLTPAPKGMPSGSVSSSSTPGTGSDPPSGAGSEAMHAGCSPTLAVEILATPEAHSLIASCRTSSSVLALSLYCFICQPPVPKVEEVVNSEANALGECRLVAEFGGLEFLETIYSEFQQPAASLAALQGAADRSQELARALHGPLLGKLSPWSAANEVLQYLLDDAGREQVPQEEMAHEAHVRQWPVLAAADILPNVPGALCVRHLLGTLELCLASVQQHAREGHGQAVGRGWRELGVPASQGEDHVCVCLAVVRVRQGGAKDSCDDKLKLLSLHKLNAGHLLNDPVQAVGADLVKQAVNATPDLLEPRRRAP
eukprot:CAMPEP_0170580308 /NCGR_PEP_ID=MMETSP0224-20130122/6440_1 /TAXON_ID=285029 /ORGANISM="Togula jolla, Strain CCCM 725" /LENGTH=414 /DNA_ID=CAMNT_0010903375 /DNA_START=80 /DNA_END=1319 /DNA_ORIENTATION=-